MADVVEEVQLQGHIIDSLLLPKVLDEILTRGGTYVIKDIRIGQRGTDPSIARLEVRAPNADRLHEILGIIHDHGAVPVHAADCETVPADMDGAFPEAFYSTSNFRTQVRLGGDWVDVRDQEMDCGIVVDLAARTARCVPMADVRKGERIVIGLRGVRVFPEEVERRMDLFEFMSSRCRARSRRERRSARSRPPCAGPRPRGRKSWRFSAPRSCTPGAASASVG